MTADNIEIGKKALELRCQWNAHDNDHCASINTLFAVFGITSKCGRIADNFSYNNTPYSTWLADIAFDAGVGDNEERPSLEGPQSDAAREMEESRLTRSGGRKVPLTSQAQKALLHYYRERLEILSRTDAFLAESRPRELHRYLSKIRKHQSSIVTIIGEVSALAT